MNDKTIAKTGTEVRVVCLDGSVFKGSVIRAHISLGLDLVWLTLKVNKNNIVKINMQHAISIEYADYDS